MAEPVFRDIVYDGTITVFDNTASNKLIARPKINFNTSQWRLENYGVVVDASQDMNPLINPYGPELNVSAAYSGRLARARITWSVFDWSVSKSTNVLQVVGGRQTGLELVLNAEYKTGVIFTQGTFSCTYKIIIQLMFVPLVANPTSEPDQPLPNITQDGNNPPEPFKWPWDTWDTPTKLLAGAFAVTALVLIVRPSAGATFISSGYKAYRNRNS